MRRRIWIDRRRLFICRRQFYNCVGNDFFKQFFAEGFELTVCFLFYAPALIRKTFSAFDKLFCFLSFDTDEKSGKDENVKERQMDFI